MSNHVLIAVIAWLLAGMFLWAVAAKLRALGDFIAVASAIAPSWAKRAARPTASLVIAFELAAAVALLARPVVGAILAIVVLLTFAGAAEGVRLSGKRIRCACFGSGGDFLGRATTVRNIGLSVLLVPVALYPPGRASIGDYRVVAAAITILAAATTLANGLSMAREIRRGLAST